MFQVTKATEYAILIFSELQKSKDSLSLSEIAKRKNLPVKYLEKIAGQLKQKNLIESKQGIKGGYKIAKNKKNISLLDIIYATEGKKGIVTCMYDKCKREKNCLHKKIWQKLQKIIIKEMKSITLADI